MQLNKSSRWLLAASLILSTAAWTACNQEKDAQASASTGGKIPVTTKSDEARDEFLKGRDLSEKLRGQESLAHFDKAIALDPEFAAAELARANNSPTAKDFFEHEKKAIALADKASDGEKLLIQANQAGTNGDVVKQKEYLDKLVAAYPNDERAQFAMGNFLFGQQEWDTAVEHYKKATEIAPNYSASYNILGYAYRTLGDYASAEQAFKKYIELIPNDPNPYDSYAELLLKMGRYDDSIAQYRKALSIDPQFNPSHFGITADLMYENKSEEAAAELQKMADQARNDGELRTAYFGMAVAASDIGKWDKALQAMDKEYAVAEKKSDAAAMAADLQAKGNILAESGKLDEARKQFEHSQQLMQTSTLSQEIKDNAKLQLDFNLTALAIGKKDYAGARTQAEDFRQKVEASKNPAQVRQYHELAGRLALAEKDFDKSIAELSQSNLQDPRNLYRLGQAYQGKGDATKAEEFTTKAAHFNSLPGLPYAFIRTKAQKMANKKG